MFSINIYHVALIWWLIRKSIPKGVKLKEHKNPGKPIDKISYRGAKTKKASLKVVNDKCMIHNEGWLHHMKVWNMCCIPCRASRPGTVKNFWFPLKQAPCTNTTRLYTDNRTLGVIQPVYVQGVSPTSICQSSQVKGRPQDVRYHKAVVATWTFPALAWLKQKLAICKPTLVQRWSSTFTLWSFCWIDIS